MASIPSTATEFRHRIKTIKLQPSKSKYVVEINLQVDGKNPPTLRPMLPGQVLQWQLLSFPFDVRADSRITLKVIEKHRGRDHIRVAEYSVSDTTDSIAITRNARMVASKSRVDRLAARFSSHSGQIDAYDVTFVFPTAREMEEAYSSNLVKGKALIRDGGGPLERLGNARHVLKTALDFGVSVAEIEPNAKLVVDLIARTWGFLEKEQQIHDDMQTLMNGLERMLPFIETVKEHAQDQLVKGTILKLLNLIEDACHFIMGYLSETIITRTAHDSFNNHTSEQLSALLRSLDRLKEDFDRSVRGELLKHTVTSEQRVFLDRLNPSAQSHYAGSSACQADTRMLVLAEIYQWCQPWGSDRRLLWMHGQAGLGKSSIAASVCRKLDESSTLGAHFFCKRDDPDLRSPERVLNTLIHRLASRFKPYGRAVATMIENNVELPNAPLEQRYTHLLEQPLKGLSVDNDVSTRSLVVLVDALDECEQGGSRRLLVTYLRGMSQLVPWLKVIVTSRPETDIKAIFDPTNSSILSLNLRDYSVSDDIYSFARKRLHDIAQDKTIPEWSEDVVRRFSERADGLFIWIQTACKFVEKGFNADTRLQQILAGTQPIEGSRTLDVLYTTAINHSMGDNAEDNLQSIRLCLGAIIATASRTPLSVLALEKLLSSHIQPGVFREVVRRLGSVLYEDWKRKGAVRVYHPSFMDYMLSQPRSSKFHVNMEEQNIMLASCCLEEMMGGLRFNICSLETSHLLNRDVPNLEPRVQDAISEHLQYSCLHWSSHLPKMPSGALKNNLGIFLAGGEFLYWIEALSLLKKLKSALSSLSELIDWISHDHSGILNNAKDAYRFVLAFYEAISESTPHLYVSALAFAPPKSGIAQRIRPNFPNTLVALNSTGDWSTWLQNMSHQDAVASVAFSSDGRRIVSGSDDSTAQIWDAETGSLAATPLLHPASVLSVAFSPDDRYIITGAHDGITRIWDIETTVGTHRSLVGHLSRVNSVGISLDGKFIVSGSADKTVRVWKTETGEIFKILLGHSSEVSSVGFSPNTWRIVSGSWDKSVRIWDTKTGAEVFQPLIGHSGTVYSVAFSPSGQHVVSGSADTTVRIWDANGGLPVSGPLVGHSDRVVSVAFSPTSTHVVSGSDDKTIRIWDVETGTSIYGPLIGHSGNIISVSFSPNGQRIASGSEDMTVRVWDIDKTSTSSSPLKGHLSLVWSIAFSPDSQSIVSGSEDGVVQIWNAVTGAPLSEPLLGHLNPVNSVAFSPSNQHIISGSSDKTIRIWDAKTGGAIAEPLIGHSDSVNSVMFSPNGKHIASGSSDSTVRIWDAETGATVSEPLIGHSAPVLSIAFSPDGEHIVSGSEDMMVLLWHLRGSVTTFETLEGHASAVRSVAFSPNGKHVASGSDDMTIQIWDAATGVTQSTILVEYSGWIGSIAFSPDSRYIVSSSWDKLIRIWEVETSSLVSRALEGHVDTVNSVAFSPNGKLIASGSSDMSVRIWDTSTSLALADSISDILSSPIGHFIQPNPVYEVQTLERTSMQPKLSTSHFTRHLLHGNGWVVVGSAVLFWLPPEYRRPDDSCVRVSQVPLPSPLSLDLSRFVHGNFWTSIVNERL